MTLVMCATATILVIDDDHAVCASCRRVLADDGYLVDVARSSEEAVIKMAARHYDLTLLDLRFPQVGGLTLLQFMRNAYPDTEVVVITGYPTIENAKESIELGAFDFVVKPLDPDKIRTVVSSALACRPWTLHMDRLNSRSATDANTK
ncbi:MAG: response regulator [Planctomycetota bacterium]|jgi:DNA-binding NtrC family response regulator